MRSSRLRHFTLAGLIMTIVVLSAQAQSPNPTTAQGWNASVYSDTNGVQPAPSYALVDATQYANGGASDLCTLINNVFNVYYGANGNGIVIDARGVSQLTCANVSPWDTLISNETGGNDAFTNVVLLPAGQITIQKTWKMILHTRLIGQGPTNTIIHAASGFTGDLIHMGEEIGSGYPCYLSSAMTWDCPGVVIEHLGLIGNNSGIGIKNCCAQELSRVNDVSISKVATGLALTDQFAQNSGPYTNLTISQVNTCLSIGPAMSGNIMINSRGVHGLQCSINSSGTAAITISGPNNSLEDISISGGSSQDGILIGSSPGASAQGNTLLNIRGNGLNNVIHISNKPGSINSSTNAGNCPYPVISSSKIIYAVCDLTIFGVARSGGNTTIQDDLTTTTITDSTLAMYTLGETIGGTSNNIGFSRFTTATAGNTTATPWLVGTIAPALASCKVGTLYSCTGSSCTNSNGTAALWECVGGSTFWKKIQ